MTVELVDAIIISIIILGAIIGFKQGAIKTLVQFLGLFIVIIISFLLKDKLMVILYKNLPFFDFFGKVRGIQSMNILLYQLISFLITFAGMMFIFKVLLVISGLIEYILKLTIFLSIPSKILGIIVGAIQYYVYIFIALYILTIPIFNIKILDNSELSPKILNDTPILSKMTYKTTDTYNDVWNILKNNKKYNNSKKNTLVLASLLDHKLITIDDAKKLVSSNKIVIDNEEILKKYTNDDKFYNKVKEIYENENN